MHLFAPAGPHTDVGHRSVRRPTSPQCGGAPRSACAHTVTATGELSSHTSPLQLVPESEPLRALCAKPQSCTPSIPPFLQGGDGGRVVMACLPSPHARPSNPPAGQLGCFKHFCPFPRARCAPRLGWRGRRETPGTPPACPVHVRSQPPCMLAPFVKAVRPLHPFLFPRPAGRADACASGRGAAPLLSAAPVRSARPHQKIKSYR
jgi:hypothetical protein